MTPPNTREQSRSICTTRGTNSHNISDYSRPPYSRVYLALGVPLRHSMTLAKSIECQFRKTRERSDYASFDDKRQKRPFTSSRIQHRATWWSFTVLICGEALRQSAGIAIIEAEHQRLHRLGALTRRGHHRVIGKFRDNFIAC